jgi:RHS repeat-associated protein
MLRPKLLALFAVVSCLGLTAPAHAATTRTDSYTYDANGRSDIDTDPRGTTTDYNFDARGFLTQKIDAANDTTGYKRTIQTDPDPTFAVPKERRTYNAVGTLVGKQTWTYNTRGQVLTSSQSDPAAGISIPRTTTTTYCEAADVTAGTCPRVGLVTKVDGPRTDVSDVTTYTYYASDDPTCASAPTTCPHRKGDLWKVTNAAGQVTTTLKYDGAGRVLSVSDPNNIVTDFEYHPRGRLLARKVRGPDNTVETDDAITTFGYYVTGLIRQVTQPDGTFTSYTYDAAHRLTDIADNAGNTIHYTLDNAGNRKQEDTKNNVGNLRRTLSRVYNQLGQLQQQADAYSHATTLSYDANGNSTGNTDALGRATGTAYDPLNRLKLTLQDVGGIAAQTTFAYDAQDNLTKVTDPKQLDTNYGYNGLGDLMQLTSPDTGPTNYTYDSAGNRKTQLDARGITSTYSYDLLNRLTSIAYSDGSAGTAYAYDNNNLCGLVGSLFAKGRLGMMTDASGSTGYCYDRWGNLITKQQTTNRRTFNVQYAYNLAGRLLNMTYPDGAVVDYIRNAQGQITEVGSTPAGGTRQVVVTQVNYLPFGPIANLTYGGAHGTPPLQRSFNLNYQPATIFDATGLLSLGYEFDAVGNLVKVRNAQQTDPPLARYGYDHLNRLSDVMDGPTGTVIEHYGYDATGNRTSVLNAGVTTPYTYPTNSHHLDHVGTVARSYDLDGNTTQIGGTAKQFTYNAANRMSLVQAGTTPTMNYQYNGKGEQVRKYLGLTNTYTVYDEAGHWLGDYDTNGVAIQQAIWMDDAPVGLLVGANTSTTMQKLEYVETDALGTPRAVIDPTRKVAIWKWDLIGEAFGATAPNQDPDADGTPFVLNMRYPGQRADAATGLNQNVYRDYEAATGRYPQPDPIGLMAGPSIYSYVGADPLHKTDPLGLAAVYGGGTFVFPIVGPLDGAVGETTLVCTDNCNKPTKYVYKKYCIGLGSGWGASLLVGRVNGMSGMSCKDPSRYAGYFLEFSGGVGVVGGGIDVGLTENSNHLPNGVSPVNEFGVGLSSSGASVLLCRYVLVRSE